MKALILDAGNTRINCAAWEGDRQVPVLASLENQVLAPAIPLFDLGTLDHPGSGRAFLAEHGPQMKAFAAKEAARQLPKT